MGSPARCWYLGGSRGGSCPRPHPPPVPAGLGAGPGERGPARPRGPPGLQAPLPLLLRRPAPAALRFGVADIAVDSLCRGVFAGDCRQLSVRSCFPALFHAERRRRSVLLGLALGAGQERGAESGLSRRARAERWSQWSLRRGMETLPEALAAFLRPRGVELRCHAPLRSLRRRHDGRWQLTLADGTVTADHVISALPAAALAEALPAEAEPLAQELRRIPTVAVAVVNLQYEGVTLPVTGFGHLVPSSEDDSLLGIVYDSVAFPQHDGTGPASVRLTVMLGGAWFTRAFGDPAAAAPATLLQRAQAAAREQLGLAVAPARSIVRVQQACIPQYTLGHWQRTGKAGDGDAGGRGDTGGTQRLPPPVCPSVCPSRRAHQPVPGGAAAAPEPRGRLLRWGLRQRLHRQRQGGRGAAPGGLSSPWGGPVPALPVPAGSSSRTKCCFFNGKPLRKAQGAAHK
uniref:Protoporphyrinogen oxidase n=1 Tax=Cairina moschata TaxID=8855 RepID=A0A8C3CT06_CAIMO